LFYTACVELTASVCRVDRTHVPDLISFRGELYCLRVLFIYLIKLPISSAFEHSIVS